MGSCTLNHLEIKEPVCRQCGELLPFDQESNAFQIFGLDPRFNLNLEDLEKRFFDLSRKIHPDKFATQGSEILINSTRWFAAVSTAYAALKDPIERAQLLFSLYGIDTKASQKSVPADLAEDYFELKELVMEAKDIHPLQEFQKRVSSQLSLCEHQMKSSLSEWDEKKSSQDLKDAAQTLHKRAFLVSMLNDLDQTVHRLSERDS